MNNIPKDYLIKMIIKNADDANIRNHFSIKEETGLFLRLNSFFDSRIR